MKITTIGHYRHVGDPRTSIQANAVGLSAQDEHPARQSWRKQSLIFFYLLIDMGKMHYKIDRVTFKAIPKVQEHIKFALLKKLQCQNDPKCALRKLVSTKSGSRRFMNDVFYYFANRDTVGMFNQKDKRRQVFIHWTKYYVFNFIMVIVFLAWLWLCFLMFLRTSVWISFGLVIFIVPMVFFWRWRGIRYRDGSLELAADQIRAFFQQAPSEVKEQSAKLVQGCTVGSCPFSRIIS